MTPSTRELSDNDARTFKGKIATDKPIPLHVRFIHIPKTAGDSVMLDSPDHLLQGQTFKGNGELPYFGTSKSVHAKPDQMAMVFLRDPKSHVLSQFLECKYDPWGQKVTKAYGFPGYLALEDPLDGFDEWVAHFALKPNAYRHHKNPRAGPYAFNCYDPWNMQTRYMVKKKNPPSIHFCDTPNDRWPSVDEAIANLQDEDLLLGITEHYSASMCLLENHATNGTLTEACRTCDPDTHRLPLVEAKQHHESHNVPHHSVDMITNQTTLDYIAKLTEIDQKLYDYAVTLFDQKVEEAKKATGMDLLCRDQEVHASSRVEEAASNTQTAEPTNAPVSDETATALEEEETTAELPWDETEEEGAISLNPQATATTATPATLVGEASEGYYTGVLINAESLPSATNESAWMPTNLTEDKNTTVFRISHRDQAILSSAQGLTMILGLILMMVFALRRRICASCSSSATEAEQEYEPVDQSNSEV